MKCKYTEEQLSFLSKNKLLPRKELTNIFNKKFNTNNNFKQIQGVCKRHDFMTGRTGKFKKGNISFNTGTKGVMKQNKTSFKKGSIPHNYKEIGSERICSKDGYIYIKTVESKKWVLKHRFIWEKHNGKIPKGKIIQFKDGNKENLSIANLECISRQENLYLNSNGFKNIPYTHKETFRLLAKVEVKIRSITTNNNNT